MSGVLKLVKSDAAGGVNLIIAAALAILLANLDSTAVGYQSFLNWQPHSSAAGNAHPLTTLFWVNDVLMVFFFLQVGLEVKRELISGALASRQQALFPLIAALGGMLAPALIFLLFTRHSSEGQSGWAIPTATDIAFALGILALLGNRVPVAIKVFLMALAVIDDLGAIVIIALFYSGSPNVAALAMAVAVIVVMAVMNRCGVRSRIAWLVAGAALWYVVLLSGIHATLAGVILGMMMPVRGEGSNSAAARLTHQLEPWVRWLILPLFAFANAGVVLKGLSVGDMLSALPLGIMAGLLIGKPLGITLVCWLSARLGITRLPVSTRISDIAAVGVLCGIGFTMSVFIATLAYGQQGGTLINEAKLGILGGSILSALCGYCLLRYRYSR